LEDNNNIKSDDVRKIISEELKKVLNERDRGTLIVPISQHYDHHKKIGDWLTHEDEWRANHNFTCSMRENVSTVRKAGLWSAAAAIISFTIAAICYFVKTGGK